MNILKKVLLMLSLELTYLINECLDLCIMPDELKVGNVTPIPKGFLP